MGARIRLYDLRASRFPRVLGLCQDNIPEIANYANSIQETLLYDKAAGEESWYGTWAEICFNVSRTEPYITLPRDIARLEFVNICDHPIDLHNQFMEYLRFGNGRMSTARCDCPGELAGYTRNNAVTFVDLSSAPQYIRMYITNDQDIAKRVLLQGTDANNKVIYSQDSHVIVTGQFVALDSPFATSPLTFNSLTGIQKDTTAGQVEFYQVDPTTGDEVLLLTMEPSETTASYRRYYFSNLPTACCSTSTTGVIQVKAIAKLEPIRMVVDTDWALLQSKEAFIEEAQALRLQESDSPSGQQMAMIHHQRAIRLLIGQVGHYEGIQVPAMNYKPFGTATFETVDLGMI